MTVYVETDFLLALAKDTDRLQESAEAALDEHEVETSAFSYLELVPVRDEKEKQVVLKSVNYYERRASQRGCHLSRQGEA